MTSINTNISAIYALQNLNKTQKALGVTQERISTGLRVNSAKDHASFFSISSAMKSDVTAFKAINDNLAITGASIAVARAGSEQVQGMINDFLERVAFAQADDSVDLELIQTELEAMTDQIENVLDQSTYNGENLLTVPDDGATPPVSQPEVTVVTGITRSGGTYATTSFKFNRHALDDVLTQLKTVNVSTAPDLEVALKAVQTEYEKVTAAATEFGLAERAIENQREFIGKLVDQFNIGIGAMVDADMNEEAARLQALQVQEQLGLQAFSIANQAPQSILSLFR